MEVQKIAEAMTVPVRIIVDAGNAEDPFQANLINIARQISGVSMNKVLLEEGEGSSPFWGKPCLTLATGTTGNIHYLTAAEGRELLPFLDALAWLGKATAIPGLMKLDSMLGLSTPVEILVLMAEACPHCPAVVRSALALAALQPLLKLIIVDAVYFHDLAERYKVKSTPTTIIDQGLTMVGHVTEDAAQLLCRENGPDAILPIYRSKEFSVRMGALVTMEEALALNPRILDPVVDELGSLLFDDEVALRGDTAELLGKIGNPAAIPALRKALEDPDPDVREAVEEALQLLEE
jgi:thiol-disulfide isomerase/thioredoxin